MLKLLMVIREHKFGFIFFLMALFSLQPVDSSGQTDSLSALVTGKSPENAARTLMRSNKNAEALEILRRHSRQQEQEFGKERDSIIGAVDAIYKSEGKQRRTAIREKEQEIAELKEGNAGIQEENRSMTTQTVIFFSIVTGLIILILITRLKVYRGIKSQLEHSGKLISSLEASLQETGSLKKTENELLPALREIRKFTLDNEHRFASVTGDRQNPHQRPLIRLISEIEIADRITTPKEEEPGAFIKTDLNGLISETAESGLHSMMADHPGFNCNLSLDLEKILPQIDLIPAEIKFVIFSLLRNAFESVKERTASAPKGYEPKVTIITRKLPRFVQVRIKDNGIGIPDKNAGKIFDAYFTTKQSDRNPGLGLTISKEIITIHHKGELFVESDFSNSTDFIIRFPTFTQM